MTREVIISKGDPTSAGATRLLTASHALMQALFPAESNHFLSIEALTGDDIRFFIAELDGEVAGCAALALRGDAARTWRGQRVHVWPGRDRRARDGGRGLGRSQRAAAYRRRPV